MRRFIQNTVALEAEAHRVAMESISLEEEQVMLDEANTAAVEADQELAEAERIIEVSNALEDLAVIADEIQEATPAETALVEIAGDMAVAGTDVSPEEIVPAMEGYVGRKIATEGIRETAASIWQSIQNYLKQVWEKIETFFYRILGTIPRLRRNLAALEAKVDETVGKTVEGNVKLHTGIAHISVAHEPAKNEADLSKGLSDLTAAAKYTFGPYVDAVTKSGEAIAKIIGGFEAAKAGETVSAARATLKTMRPANPPGASGGDKGRFPGFVAAVGTPLFGNISLAAKHFVDNSDDKSDLGALDRYRNSRTELIPTSDKVPTGATKAEIELTPLSTSGAKKLIKDIESLLDVMEDYKRGPKGKALDKTAKSIEDASSKAAKALATANAEGEAARVLGAQFRALANFNTSYARWAQTPAVPMMSHCLTTIKTLMVVIQKSMAAYK